MRSYFLAPSPIPHCMFCAATLDLVVFGGAAGFGEDGRVSCRSRPLVKYCTEYVPQALSLSLSLSVCPQPPGVDDIVAQSLHTIGAYQKSTCTKPSLFECCKSSLFRAPERNRGPGPRIWERGWLAERHIVAQCLDTTAIAPEPTRHEPWPWVLGVLGLPTRTSRLG